MSEISDSHVKNVCKHGQGAKCCRYLGELWTLEACQSHPF